MTILNLLKRNSAVRISLIYLIVAGVWIFSSDKVLEYLFGDSTLLTQMQTLKGGFFILITSGMLYLLIAQQHPVKTPKHDHKVAPWQPLAVFILLAVAISVSGWYVYNSLRSSIEHEVEVNLAKTGTLKKQQIENWFEDHYNAIQVATDFSSLSAREMGRMLKLSGKEKAASTELVKNRLDVYIRNYHYQSITMFDLQGNVALMVGEPNKHPEEEHLAALQSMQQQRIQLVDLHLHHLGKQSVPSMGLITPLIFEGAAVGALYFAIDPSQFIYPMLEQDSLQSLTEETYLLRIEGQQVRILSPRHHDTTPLLEFTQALDDPILIASAVARGERGIINGHDDFLGHPVVAYATAINHTPWLLITKINEHEVYQSIRHAAMISALLTVFFLLVFGCIVWLWWERERNRSAALKAEAHNERQALMQHYDYLSRYANDIIILTDTQGRFIEINERALEVYGYTRDEMLGMTMADLRTNDAANFHDPLRNADFEGLVYEARHRCKDGSIFTAEISSRLIDKDDRAYLHLVIRDISERKQAETRIARLTQLYATLSRVNEAIVHIGEDDFDEITLFKTVCDIAVNQGGMKLAWIGRLNADSQQIEAVAFSGDGTDYLKGLAVSARADIESGRGPTGSSLRENHPIFIQDFMSSSMTTPWHERAKQYQWHASAAIPIPRADKPYAVLTLYHNVIGAFDEESQDLLKEIAGDISFALDNLDVRIERMQAQSKIEYLAHFDPLTKLPNRTLLTDRVNNMLQLSTRDHSGLALLYLDLDRFKNVNDSLGHAVGDKLLQQVADRLSETLRDVDTVSRFGGDEFVALLPGTDSEGATRVASKLIEVLAKPYHIKPHDLSLTASIGIAMFPENGQDFATLSRAADTALYRAKHAGRNGYQFFTEELHRKAMRTLEIEGALRHALERNELVVYYQPQVDAMSSRIVGAEALVRWQHPQWGLTPPGEFIPIAEEVGLIADIGDWVMREAIRQNAEWQQQGLSIVPVAVNLSMMQFRQNTLVDMVSATLSEFQLKPEFLELELTESIAMENIEFTISTVQRLHALGPKLSIDDFGTGYSSLSYLKRFAVDKLKIDQSFVQNLAHDANDEAIVIAIINMAKSLGFRVIAEGVETAEQFAFLRARQCDEIQGYLFSRPVAAEAFAKLLAMGVLEHQ